MEKPIVHSYLSDGMFELGKVFTKSIANVSGDKFSLFLTTRGLTQDQCDELFELHPDIAIDNNEYDFELMAEYAGVSIDQLLQYKKEVESRYVTKNNKVWKLMVAADDRPKSLAGLLFNDDFDVDVPVLHFDIDTLFRKDIYPLVDDAISHDCCLLYRPDHPNVKARITISTMTFIANQNTFDFFDRWFHYLDAVPPKDRPIGYGQTSCWLGFRDVQKNLNYKKLSPKWGYPGKKSNGPNNFVWSGAVHKLAKDDCVKMFSSELEGIK